MDFQMIMVLVNAGLAVAAMLLGAKWGIGKGKINQAVDVAITVMNAIEDDNVTPEEEKAIVAKVKAMLPQKSG